MMNPIAGMVLERTWNQGDDSDFHWEFVDSLDDVSDLLDAPAQTLSSNIKIIDFSGLTFTPDTFNEHAGFKQVELWQQ